MMVVVAIAMIDNHEEDSQIDNCFLQIITRKEF